MQRKQMWILNVALAGFAGLMAFRLAGDWKRGNERYRTLNQRVQMAALPVMPAAQASPAATDIVSRNLFSPDRNNNRAQVQQAQPPLPVVMGTMRLGDGYEALMAEGGSAASAARFRRVKEGEQIGGYTVSKIRD